MGKPYCKWYNSKVKKVGKMSIDFSKELNEQQYQAVTSDAKHLRIIAGAGTGKTRVLTYRLAYLISERHIQPRKIVAITFTNKVAKEMRDRVANLVSEEDKLLGSPLISTFHGFCYRFLVREINHIPVFTNHFQIADDEVQNSIFKEFADKLNYKLKSPYMSELISTMRQLKTRGVFPEEISASDVPMGAAFNFSALNSFYKTYQDRLKKTNMLDFDDLLMFSLKILKENDSVRRQWQHYYDVFLVDEFQDTNRVQYDLIKCFMDDNTELAVVGDPDQTIYTWRGADNDIVRFILDKDFPDLVTIMLEDNYRSTQSILDMANRLIKNNSNRIDKNLVAANKVVGEKVDFNRCNSQDMEAKQIATAIFTEHKKGTPYNDFAIIYRSNYLSRAIESALSQAGIPYRLYGALKFYDRAEIKDALSYFRLLVNPEDTFSFARILKAPTKGIAEKGVGELSNVCAKYDCNPIVGIRDHLDEMTISTRSKNALAKFVESYDRCNASLEANDDLEKISKILNKYLEECGFLEYVKELDRKKEEKESSNNSDSKYDNVLELLSYVDTFMSSPVEEGMEATLEDFLILVAIQSAQDDIENESKTVTVMTAHISKGLEFPRVFVAGLSQGVFPSNHALNAGTKKAIEEERRLLYVAMTRAKQKLSLSCFGGYNFIQGGDYAPSMFLKELGFFDSPAYMGEPRERENYTPNRNAQNEYQRIQNLLNKRMATETNPPARRGIVRDEVKKDTYVPGDKLVHTSYGIGTVTAVNGDRLTVEFKEAGTKILMNGFKAFKKLETK